MSNTYDFCIQPPKWQKIFFIVAIIFSVALSVIVTVLWLIFRFDWGLLVGAIFLAVFVSSLSLLGLWVFKKDKFCLQGETFIWSKPFKKTKTVAVEQIARVEVSGNIFDKITFIGKNEGKILSFNDDGKAFANNNFLSALSHYDIPIKRK
jgi:hypothetical protein